MSRSDLSSQTVMSATTPIKTASGSTSEIPARGMTPPQSASTPAQPTMQQYQGSSSSFYGSTTALTVTPPNSAGLKIPCKFLASPSYTTFLKQHSLHKKLLHHRSFSQKKSIPKSNSKWKKDVWVRRPRRKKKGLELPHNLVVFVS